MKKGHTFHIPVMGIGFSIDTPVKVAQYGISSVISLVDDNLIEEMRRIMTDDGRLYLSVPNYASILHMIPLVTGRSFHDPLDPVDRYEFYAHVRYFTYRTLIDLFRSFDLFVDTVYIMLPKGASRYLRLKERSPLKAFLYRQAARCAYTLSPRFHPGPIVCFMKTDPGRKIRKVMI